MRRVLEGPRRERYYRPNAASSTLHSRDINGATNPIIWVSNPSSNATRAQSTTAQMASPGSFDRGRDAPARRLPNSFYPPSCDRFEMKEEAALLRLVRCHERSCPEVGRNSVLEHLQPILFGGRVHEAAPCPLIGVRISGSRRGGAVLNSWAARVRRRRVRAIMMSLGARCSSRWSTTGPMLSVIAMS
jgi:hypothetical protein